MKENSAFELPFPVPAEDVGSGFPAPDEALYWELKEQRVYWIDYEISDNYNLITLAKEIIKLNREEQGGN